MAALGQAVAKPVSARGLQPVAQRVVHTRVVGAHAFFEVYEPCFVQNASANPLTPSNRPDLHKTNWRN